MHRWCRAWGVVHGLNGCIESNSRTLRGAMYSVSPKIDDNGRHLCAAVLIDRMKTALPGLIT